jgi:hypothetical protein
MEFARKVEVMKGPADSLDNSEGSSRDSGRSWTKCADGIHLIFVNSVRHRNYTEYSLSDITNIPTGSPTPALDN